MYLPTEGVVKPHGGMIVWRAFVYGLTSGATPEGRDLARASYNEFHRLDGAFDDNVVLQIKNGP